MERRRHRGFSLLEVMVALMILSMSFMAISALQTTTITMNATVHRSTTASHLLHWAMTGIEIEYAKEGFPTNTISGRDCELPDGFNDYTCSYDLVAMDITPDQISELSMASMGSLLGGNMENLNGLTDQLKNAGQAGTALDPSLLSMFAFAAPFFGPDAQYLQQMCPVDWSGVFTGLMATQMFLPQVVKFASDRIRKLKVTIEWKEGFRGRRTFVAETFVTSLPEEMMKAAEQAEEMQNLQDQLSPGGTPPGTPPGNPPPHGLPPVPPPMAP
jgi:prepilin-type N-terminal cleavage/methylation domain-containing protein